MSQWLHETAALMGEVSWGLILVICLLGGLLAWLGDRVGMKFAKKKVSLFGLRPRHTSSIITGVTGLGIALLVMLSLALTSDTVRTALFSMNYLRRQTLELTAKLQNSTQEQQLAEMNLASTQTQLYDTREALKKAQTDVSTVVAEADKARLQAERAQEQVKQAQEQVRQATKQRDELESNIKKQRAELTDLKAQSTALQEQVDRLQRNLKDYQQGNIVADAGERLTLLSFEADDLQGVRAAVAQALRQTRAEVARREGVSAQYVTLKVDDAQIDDLVKQALSLKGRKALAVTVAGNLVPGVDVDLRFTLSASKLVYRQGEQLARTQARMPLQGEDANSVVNGLLQQVKQRAKTDGMIGDPHQGTVGDLDAGQYYQLVARLQRGKGDAVITATAARDTYSEEPLRVDLALEEQ